MSSTETELATLLEAARTGDMVALDQLLKAVQPQIYRFGMKMCRHPEDAEDVLQETMLALARSLRDFRGGASMSTWMYTIARNSCAKKRRKSTFAPAQEESLDGLSLLSEDAGPQTLMESRQAWEQVGEAIRLLDDEQREVLLLRDVEGLSASEVAEVVGVSVGAVKSRLHRARAGLRDTLALANISRADINDRTDSCVDIRLVFSRHLEGDLADDICETMEAHVASCAHCAVECKGLNEVLQICRTSPCEAPPAEVQERIKAALETALAANSSSSS